MIGIEELTEAVERDVKQSHGLDPRQLAERFKRVCKENDFDFRAVEAFCEELARVAVSSDMCCHYHAHIATAKSMFDVTLKALEANRADNG